MATASKTTRNDTTTKRDVIVVGAHLNHPLAQLPSQHYSRDAGFDLFSVERKMINIYEQVVVNTGLSLSIPDNYYGR